MELAVDMNIKVSHFYAHVYIIKKIMKAEVAEFVKNLKLAQVDSKIDLNNQLIYNYCLYENQISYKEQLAIQNIFNLIEKNNQFLSENVESFAGYNRFFENCIGAKINYATLLSDLTNYQLFNLRSAYFDLFFKQNGFPIKIWTKFLIETGGRFQNDEQTTLLILNSDDVNNDYKKLYLDFNNRKIKNPVLIKDKEIRNYYLKLANSKIKN